MERPTTPTDQVTRDAALLGPPAAPGPAATDTWHPITLWADPEEVAAEEESETKEEGAEEGGEKEGKGEAKKTAANQQ
jgi:hypothetical protein